MTRIQVVKMLGITHKIDFIWTMSLILVSSKFLVLASPISEHAYNQLKSDNLNLINENSELRRENKQINTIIQDILTTTDLLKSDMAQEKSKTSSLIKTIKNLELSVKKLEENNVELNSEMENLKIDYQKLENMAMLENQEEKLENSVKSTEFY